MAEDKRTSMARHTLVMERRENIRATGVLDVISFDEETIIADSDMGVLVIRGQGLHVNRLDLESGDLEIDGEITSLHYEDQANYGKGKSSFFGKLFK